MFYFNGFQIVIKQDKVVANQQQVHLEFKTVEEALEALCELGE